jgi:hypothetical protein
MEGVIFEEEVEPTRKVAPVKQSSLSKLVISSGLAKTVAQAEQVMLIIAVVCLVIAVGIVVAQNLPPSQESQAAMNAANAKLKLEQIQEEQQRSAH